MKPPSRDEWDALKLAFAELADLDPAARTARLDIISAENRELAEHLAGLLAGDDAAELRLARFALLSGDALPADSAAADPLGLIGSTIAHFHITEVLGAGGMGVAYRARDERLGRAVALKFLLPQYSLDVEAQRRLLHEARSPPSGPGLRWTLRPLKQ